MISPSVSIPPTPSDEVLVALRRIIRATDLHSRRLLAEHGLTGPQLVVLRQVARAGEISGSELAAAVSVSLPTVTGIVTRLEERGWVSRRRSRSDRRRVLVSVTGAGRELLDAAPPPLQQRFVRAFEGLEDWERSQILAVLQRIVAMMEADGLDASPMLATGPIEPPARGADETTAGDALASEVPA